MEYSLSSALTREWPQKGTNNTKTKDLLNANRPASCRALLFMRVFKEMPTEPISHPFFHIEVEHVSSSDEVYLVKILSIDGRRFTYELHAPLREDAVTYIKSLLDAVVFSDLIIEWTADGFEARESRGHLKKHS